MAPVSAGLFPLSSLFSCLPLLLGYHTHCSIRAIHPVARALTGYRKTHDPVLGKQLGVAGYIETVRGRNGDLCLAMPPGEINFGEIVRRMEPDLDIVPCFNASSAGIIEPACILKDAIDEALDAFLAVLDRYTLADLVTPRRKLATLLNAQPRPL